MTNYKKITTEIRTEVIERIADDSVISYIPLDPANTDYQAYLAWVAEGNVAEEWIGN